MPILLGIFSLYLFAFLKLPVWYRDEIHIPLVTADKISLHHNSSDNISVCSKTTTQRFGESPSMNGKYLFHTIWLDVLHTFLVFDFKASEMEIFELLALFNENRPRYQTKQSKVLFFGDNWQSKRVIHHFGPKISGFLSNFKLKIVN